MMPTRRRFLGACGAAIVSPSLAGATRRHGFEPDIGVCQRLENAAVAQRAGCSYLEIACTRNLAPHAPEEEFEKKLHAIRAAPIPARAANSFLPGSLRATGDDARHDDVLAYAEVAFQRARRVGMSTITFGSSGARSLPEGYPRSDAAWSLSASRR